MLHLHANRLSIALLGAATVLAFVLLGLAAGPPAQAAPAGIAIGAPDGSRPAAPAPGRAQATTCAPNWNLVPSPNPLTNNYLKGVAAVGPNDVWAVGRTHDANNGALGGTLIEHWDGTSWTQVPGPGGTIDHQGRLNAVAAVGPNDVWAVGMYYPGTAGQTLIEHWNGTAWSVVPSPNRPGYNELLGVTAIAADDVWAVGYSAGDHATLTQHWNGSFWAIVPSPPPSSLYNYILTAVSAVASNDVWAVGYMEGQSGQSQPVLEHWDGTAWTLVASPRPGAFYTSFYGVTALASNDVWAVGAYSNDGGSTFLPAMVHWNGSTWSVVPANSSHIFNDLRAVSAAAPDDIWAVGLATDCDLCLEFRTLIQHWNGATWSEVPSPDGSNEFDRLFGVVAVSSSDVWTVGYSDQYNYPYLSDTLIARHTCAPTPTVTGTPPTATRTATVLPSATPTVCSPATSNYAITQAAGATVVPATTDTGLHTDESTTTIALPFAFSLYGQSFTSVIAGSNGTLGFVANSNTWRTSCLPSQEFDYAILPYWQDLHLSNQGGGCPGCGIYTAVTGTAPNRVFDIEWRARDYFYTSPVNVEVRLYENSPTGQFDVIYGQVPSGTDQQVTVGVQKGQGFLYTQQVCSSTFGTIANGTRLVFAQPPCNATATPGPSVTAVASATVPPGASATAPAATATGMPSATRTLPPATGTPAAGSPTATSVAATATPCGVTFSDVHPADYFYTPVGYLACHGVISGYSDGTFRPYANTTRAQMVKIVVLGFGRPIATPPAGGTTFADVPPDHPFFAVIETAAGAGIISGYTCGGPGEPCDARNRP
ncbi:MAG TPA: S-layer homology domain-containing protein, partial [Chloroflexia bacterium]|nr:S-layer homology domain-containing protein [Chloroflexia bacterium]